MAIYWPTPCFQGRTFKLCVLTRWDFNFCVRSSPLRGTRTERGACCSVSQHHIVGTDDKDTGQCLAAPYRTTGRQKKTTHHKVSLSKDKQEQKTGAYNSSMLCSFFQLLHWEYIFKSFVRLCADSLAMRDSRAIFFFFTLRCLVCWTHTQISFRRCNVAVGAEKSVWSFRTLTETCK